MASKNDRKLVEGELPAENSGSHDQGGYTPDPLYPSTRPGNGVVPPAEELPGRALPDQYASHDPADIKAARIAKQLLAVGVKDWGWPDDPLWKSHPQLARFLFKGSWNGYEPRQPGRISVRITTSGFACTLTCPSESKSLEGFSNTWTGLLDDLEDRILHHQREWKELKNGPGVQKLREERKKLRDTRKQDL